MKRLITSNHSIEIPPLHNVENDSLIYNGTDKADLLNTYFCSISDLDDNYINPPSCATRTDERLTHITTICNDVLDVLQVLKLGKTSGLDHISHHMLKYTASTVCKPLQFFFTFSLRLVVFPDNWKTALVLPMYENGTLFTLNYVIIIVFLTTIYTDLI